MAQSELFDAEKGLELKQAGMKAAAENKKRLLVLARDIAVKLAAAQDEITADDVYERMQDLKLSPHLLGNAWGSVFAKQFVPTGKWVRSGRTSRHGNAIRVWKLKPR